MSVKRSHSLGDSFFKGRRSMPGIRPAFDAGWLLARRKLPNWRLWKRLGLAFMCFWFLLIGLLSALMLPGWGLLITLLAAATASAPYFAACALPATEAPTLG
jgi:hypothetical protein